MASIEPAVRPAPEVPLAPAGTAPLIVGRDDRNLASGLLGHASFASICGMRRCGRLTVTTVFSAMTVPLVGLCLAATVAVAGPATALSMQAGRRAIEQVFRQELTYASDPVITAHLGRCTRLRRSSIDCDSSAILNHSGQRVRCSKYYRATRGRGRHIDVTESTSGVGWRGYARPTCVTWS